MLRYDPSGTTAHVGISLYGVNKSGSRHLQRDGAFQRGSLDQFHLETDDNLGEVWKIRIWHDNTGTWKLQKYSPFENIGIFLAPFLFLFLYLNFILKPSTRPNYLSKIRYIERISAPDSIKKTKPLKYMCVFT